MPIYSYSYSLPYLILLLLFIFLFYYELSLKNKNEKIDNIRWITILAFIFFFGLRGYIYTDWLVYKPIFDGIPTIWDKGFKNFDSIYNSEIAYQLITDPVSGAGGIEKGFLVYIVIFKSLIPNYFIWVFINTVIHTLILDRFFYRYSNYYVFSFILYIVFGGLIIEINLMRNIFAILLFIISIKYIREKKFIKYLIINLLGFTFHSSALLYIPLYFILNKEWPNWLIWTIFIVGNLMFIVHIEYLKPILILVGKIVGGRIDIQINAFYNSELYSRSFNFGLGYIERTITYFVIMRYKRVLISKNKEMNIFINSFFIYLIIYLYFFEMQVFIERMTLLFAFSYWIIFPNILNYIKKRQIFIVILLFYACLKIMKINSNILSRYDNQLFGIESFDNRKNIIDKNIDKLLYN